MEENSRKSKLFLKLLGFIFLAGGIALIILGTIYILKIKNFTIPEELYYIAGGTLDVFIGAILWIFGFRKLTGKNEKILKKAEEKFTSDEFNSVNTWPSEQDTSEQDSWAASPNKWAAVNPSEAKEYRPKQSKHETAATAVCYRCNTQNNATDYYCKNCKSSLKKVCPFCGHGNNPSIDTCEGCGKVF